MGFEMCYLRDMSAVLRALTGAENSIERWWQQLETAQKRPDGHQPGGDAGNLILQARAHIMDLENRRGERVNL